MKISTIVVCMGQVDDTRRCLQSLISENVENHSILIVENGTTENKVVLEKEFPQVPILSLRENIGFAGGCNAGISEAQRRWNPDFYFFLNNDAWIEKGTIQILINAMSADKKIGMASPKILCALPEKKIWSAGGEFKKWRFLSKNRGQGEEDHGQYDQRKECNFLSGCALMVRKEVIEEVGLLDERFFCYAEDLDYSLRCCQQGWKLLYVPESRVIHRGSVSAGHEYAPFQSFYRWRNRVLVSFKHAGFSHKLFIYLIFFPALMVRDMLQYLQKGYEKNIPYLWRGLFQFFSLAFNSPNVQSFQPFPVSQLQQGYLVRNPGLLALLKMIDYLGAQIVKIRNLKKKVIPPTLKKILVTKIDHLGDVIMALPVIASFKRSFPDAEVHFICGSWARTLVEKNPFIDKIITFDHFMLNRNGNLLKKIVTMMSNLYSIVTQLRNDKYDLAIDLRAYFPNFIPFFPFCKIKYTIGYPTAGFGFLLDHAGSWEERRHETDYFYDLLRSLNSNIKKTKVDFNYLIDWSKTNQFLKENDLEKSPFVLIHPYCIKSNKPESYYWPLEKWRKTILLLESKGWKVFCSGDEEDKTAIRKVIVGTSVISIAGSTSIGLLAGLIKHAKIVISVDTFTAHLSAVMEAPTIVLFYETNTHPAVQWTPQGTNVKVISVLQKPEDLISEINHLLN